MGDEDKRFDISAEEIEKARKLGEWVHGVAAESSTFKIEGTLPPLGPDEEMLPWGDRMWRRSELESTGTIPPEGSPRVIGDAPNPSPFAGKYVRVGKDTGPFRRISDAIRAAEGLPPLPPPDAPPLQPLPFERVASKRNEFFVSIVVALLLSISPERSGLVVVLVLSACFLLMLRALWDDPRFGATLSNRIFSAVIMAALLAVYGVWAWPRPPQTSYIQLLPPSQWRPLDQNSAPKNATKESKANARRH